MMKHYQIHVTRQPGNLVTWMIVSQFLELTCDCCVSMPLSSPQELQVEKEGIADVEAGNLVRFD